MQLQTMPISAFLNLRPCQAVKPNLTRIHTGIPSRALTQLVLSIGGQVDMCSIHIPEVPPMPYSFDYVCWDVSQHVTEQYYLAQALRD